jgi:hypothetical protein
MLGGGRRTGIAWLSITAAVLLICSASFAWRGSSKYQQFRQWFVDRPCDLTIDASQAGTTRSPFIQPCSFSHGEAICLALDAEGDGGSAEDLSDRLKGLAGQVVIQDLEGREVARQSFRDETVMPGYSLREVCHVFIDPFETGSYTITFEIESGAAGLSGVRQRAFARYLLCGAEALPAVKDAGWAVLFGLPGLIMAIVLLVVILRGPGPAQASDAGLGSQEPRPDHDG